MTEKEYSQVVAQNLRRIAYESGKSQIEIARDLNINKGTLSAWMNGTRTPKMPKIDMLCAYFGVNRSDLMEPHSNPIKRPPTRIPVLGRVAAGIPIDAIEDVLDWEEITPSMAMTGQYFGLKVKGDSMLPRIVEGDVVIVRCQPDAESGDVVIVQVNGNEATCKRLSKHPSGISLISFNPAYEPFTYTNEQIESLPVTIIGKVVENRQKY